MGRVERQICTHYHSNIDPFPVYRSTQLIQAHPLPPFALEDVELSLCLQMRKRRWLTMAQAEWLGPGPQVFESPSVLLYPRCGFCLP